MTQEQFEEIVSEGIKAIPEKFLKKLKNVAIVIDDEPTPIQKEKLKLRQGWSLFGLYEGAMLYNPLWDLNNGITFCKKHHYQKKK